MTWRPTEPRPEKKLHRAETLTAQHIGREITVGGQPWPVRGVLQSAEPHKRGLVVLTVLKENGYTSVATVPSDTSVLVHRKKETA